MNINKSILMVVDVQKGFLTNETRHVLPAVIDLVRQWQEAGGKTIYSRYYNHVGSAFERLMNWRQLYSPPETDIVEDLVPYVQRSVVVLDKDNYSALTQEFSELSRRYGWTDIVICGIDTDLCVLKTALDAFECGLTPWVVPEASASTGGHAAHEAGLAVIGRAIGEQHLIATKKLITCILNCELS